MARTNVLNAGMLDNYIIVSRPVVTEDVTDGDLIPQSDTPITELWGHIKELKSSTDIFSGRKRSSRTVEITVRTRDAEQIDIDDNLTFGQITGAWQINDIWESDWRYGTTILAQRID